MFAWPESALAAVSLTFDDGMKSQREVGVPLLNQYGVYASFYVNPREDYAEMLQGWRPAVEAGHEIGNHTITHPCSKNFAFISDAGRRSLEEMSLDEIGQEIDETNRRLSEILPDQGTVSFAYPCYQPFVGRGAGRQSYVPVVLNHCVAGRGRGERSNDPRYCDLGYVWSWPCERMPAHSLIGLVEEAIKQGRWAILTFHGIHEGHLSVAEGDLSLRQKYHLNTFYPLCQAKIAAFCVSLVFAPWQVLTLAYLRPTADLHPQAAFAQAQALTLLY